MKKDEKLSYEEAVVKLEAIVKRMESGELALEESVKAYEEGMKLIKFCENELTKYEKLLSGTEGQADSAESEEI